MPIYCVIDNCFTTFFHELFTFVYVIEILMEKFRKLINQGTTKLTNANSDKWTVKFDMSNDDTCHKEWIFNLRKNSSDIIIESVDIIQSGKGCKGHPKTISALVRNISINELDLEALSEADCVHDTSCGMVLASCVEAIKNSSK